MKKMKRLLISILIIFTLTSFTIYSINNFNSNSINVINNDTIEVVDTLVLLQNKKDSLKSELINSVTEYINQQAPKSHDSIPTYLVNYALEYDIDLCFMMGQTQIETNFGTSGAGRESSKRSLFGVHIYPGTPFKGYKNYDIAIEDYCKLLRKSYLVNGRDEKFLMRNYINRSGNRYAVAQNYEVHLTNTYRMINKSTNIAELQTQYNAIVL
jgi:flagellum-specific peptidoglycan hydrolase FlgJ